MNRRPTWTWQTVMVHVQCAGSDSDEHPPHGIRRGAWALLGPYRHHAPRMAFCEDEATRRGFVRKDRPFTMAADGDRDVKSNQTGERE